MYVDDLLYWSMIKHCTIICYVFEICSKNIFRCICNKNVTTINSIIYLTIDHPKIVFFITKGEKNYRFR